MPSIARKKDDMKDRHAMGIAVGVAKAAKSRKAHTRAHTRAGRDHNMAVSRAVKLREIIH
jgi:hypothetical protein